MGCGSSGSLEVDLDKDILDRSPSDEALDSGLWLLLTSFWDRDLGRPPGLTTTTFGLLTTFYLSLFPSASLPNPQLSPFPFKYLSLFLSLCL